MMEMTAACKHLALCATVLGFLVADESGRANLVVNGSFENTQNTFVASGLGANQDTMPLTLGSTAIPGWTVTTAALAWIGPSNPFGLSAAEGSYFLDLSGYHDNQPYGGVAASTAFATTIGQQYQVTFDLGSDKNYNTASPQVDLAVNGGPAQVFVASPIGNAVNRWEIFSYVFTATTASTTLSFAGAGPDNQKYIGLDNVSVVPVPEPATAIAGLLLLLPFGVSTLRILRRNRAA
jgi:hypothetical protein